MPGSELLNAFSESQTLALSKKVRELRASGKDVVGLTLGEPNFDTPVHIRNAAIYAIREGHTHYPPVAGIPELRKAAAEKFRRDNGLPYNAENIVVSTGAKQSLANVVISLCNPGDEVLLIAPYWVSYQAMILLAHATPVVVQTGFEQQFKVKPAQLEKALNDKTRIVIFNSPSNPSGAMYTRKEFDAIAKVLEKYPDLYIISDEIYEHISYGEEHISLASYPKLFDRVITVNGVSKSFAMTGWRIGYIGAPKWIAELCEKYQGQITSGASSISQYAAVEAISGEMYPTYAMRDQFRERRDMVYDMLKKIPGFKTFFPQGAFYFYPDVSEHLGKKTKKGKVIKDIDDFTDYLLNEGLVAVIPGSAFGTEKHVRISFAYSMEELHIAMERIRKAVSQLK